MSLVWRSEAEKEKPIPCRIMTGDLGGNDTIQALGRQQGEDRGERSDDVQRLDQEGQDRNERNRGQSGEKQVNADSESQ